MSPEPRPAKIPDFSSIPGLSEWQEKQVLLLRCSDISKVEFLDRVDKLFAVVEDLFEQSLPESMDEGTYLSAQEYYDAASDSLDCYLSGLEALKTWVTTNNDTILESARANFAQGDVHTQRVIPLAIAAQESFRETDEAVLQSLRSKSEGIGWKPPES